MKRCCHLGFASLHIYTFLDMQALGIVSEEATLDFTSTVPFFPKLLGARACFSLPLELILWISVSY